VVLLVRSGDLGLSHPCHTEETMPTIRKRGQGLKKYRVQVRRIGSPPLSKTFHLLKDARAWATQMELQADRRELPPNPKALQEVTLGELAHRSAKGKPQSSILVSLDVCSGHGTPTGRDTIGSLGSFGHVWPRSGGHARDSSNAVIPTDL